MWTKIGPVFILLVIILFTSTTAIKFKFTLKGSDKRCFSELLSTDYMS